ncbi:MFS transporter [Antrihabitans cavernicola]|uniref:MFS transporter n=1 Tax=Antrihabitans cavernicola TaxID=2495913 RepID=A0A5A7S8W0_9NOCA|nr:MFS transporter [Spelaeibacter cavernicola]KAA0021649.1 MFS transporter [Spelaeibacter cavernicola]
MKQAIKTLGVSPRDELETATMRQVRWRILPLIVLLYLIAYIDRNNVGFARSAMESDLGLSDAAYGLGAGIFFIGYVLMEIPSNAGMYRFGARKWIARILISWGIMATAMTLVHNEMSFYIIRFLLGAAEAGFFPAVLFYFTLWFPAAQRVSVLGIFVMAQPVANALGSPMSGVLLDLDGTWGLQGWQWMFLVEGVPAIVLGALVPFLLTDRPAHARWLADDQRIWLTATMDAENAAKASTAHHPFLAGLKDRRAWVYGALNFGMVCGIYGLGLWLPTIVKGLGDYSNTTLGWLVMIPYAAAVPCVYYWSRRADRTGKRALHAAISLTTAAVGLLGAAYLFSLSPVLALIMLCVAAIGIYSAIAPFLSIPSAVFAGAAAAAGLGLVNSLGNIGGFVAPYIVGLIKDTTGSNPIALTFLAACLITTAIIGYLYASRRPEGDATLTTQGATQP